MKSKKYAQPKSPTPMQPMSPRERREAMRADFAKRVEAENKGRKPRTSR
jgi:hypothetical protein